MSAACSWLRYPKEEQELSSFASGIMRLVRAHHHRIGSARHRLPNAKELEYGDNHHDQTDNINNLIHVFLPFIQ